MIIDGGRQENTMGQRLWMTAGCALFALNAMGCSAISAGGRNLFSRSPDCASVAAPTPECPDPDAAFRQKQRDRLESQRAGASVARGFSIASIVVGSTILVGGGLLTGLVASDIEPCTDSVSSPLSGGRFRSMDDFGSSGGGSACGPGAAIALGVTTGLVSAVLITLGVVGVVKMNSQIQEIDKQLNVTVKSGPGTSQLLLTGAF
jgi:hypothetical protein